MKRINGYTFKVPECAEMCYKLIDHYGYDQSRELREYIESQQKTINYLQKWKDNHENLTSK